MKSQEDHSISEIFFEEALKIIWVELTMGQEEPSPDFIREFKELMQSFEKIRKAYEPEVSTLMSKLANDLRVKVKASKAEGNLKKTAPKKG